jgi:hypothetical protein
VYPGPSMHMFHVLDRTGPPNLEGPRFCAALLYCVVPPRPRRNSSSSDRSRRLVSRPEIVPCPVRSMVPVTRSPVRESGDRYLHTSPDHIGRRRPCQPVRSPALPPGPASPRESQIHKRVGVSVTQPQKLTRTDYRLWN